MGLRRKRMQRAQRLRMLQINMESSPYGKGFHKRRRMRIRRKNSMV